MVGKTLIGRPFEETRNEEEALRERVRRGGGSVRSPGEKDAAEEGENLVGEEPDQADENDDRVDTVKVPPAPLRLDELGETALHPDEFGDDKPGPGPAEEDAEVIVKVRQDARDNDFREEL